MANRMGPSSVVLTPELDSNLTGADQSSHTDSGHQGKTGARSVAYLPLRTRSAGARAESRGRLRQTLQTGRDCMCRGAHRFWYFIMSGKIPLCKCTHASVMLTRAKCAKASLSWGQECGSWSLIKPQSLLSQERMKLRTSNLAGTFTLHRSIRTKPIKILVKRERGRVPGLPKFFGHLQLSQEPVKQRTSNFVREK